MPNLNDWIKAQLKRGHKAKQIKQLLASKGYPPSAVAEVNKITSPKKDKKKLSLTVVVLVIIVVSLVVYFNFWSGEKVILEPQPSIESLCSEFKESGYQISCNEAVAFALADRQGTIQNISIGTKRIPRESEGKILIKDTRLWLIDIRLDEPFYDENLNKEIKLLRAGIGTDEHFGIHRTIIK